MDGFSKLSHFSKYVLWFKEICKVIYRGGYVDEYLNWYWLEVTNDFRQERTFQSEKIENYTKEKMLRNVGKFLTFFFKFVSVIIEKAFIPFDHGDVFIIIFWIRINVVSRQYQTD